MFFNNSAIIVCICAIYEPAQAHAIIPGEDTATGDQKIYCNATLEDDFADNRVMVVLSNEPSLDFNSYQSADFLEIGCASVCDLSQTAGERIQNKVSAVTAAAKSRSTELDSLDVSEINTYNKVLCLELEQSGKANVLSAIEQLMERDDVIYAGPDYALSLCSTTVNDRYYEDQWALSKIQAPEAWDISIGSSDVVVGVLDSGIDTTHPDLAGRVNVTISADFTSDNVVYGVSADPYGHGTRTAGVIGALGNNSIGVAGICRNVTLVSLRVFNDTGAGYSSDLATAIDYADTLNIPILNFSGRWYSDWNSYDYVLDTVIQNYPGLFVCSAGNENANNDTASVYPANLNYSNLITVGASTSTDTKWSSSSYGKTTVDIFAPGESVMTTFAGGSYSTRNGTSIATPHVTAVAALMLSHNPDLSAANIKSIILEHCDKLESFSEYCVSGGRLNAYQAVLHATRQLTIGESIEKELSTGEYHWYKFVVPEDGMYSFFTEYTDSYLDVIGELFYTIVPSGSVEGRIVI